MTRPDMAASVRTVAKFSDNPGKVHWNAVLQIIQYLLRERDLGFTFRCAKENDVQMSAYVDADHAVCIDCRYQVD